MNIAGRRYLAADHGPSVTREEMTHGGLAVRVSSHSGQPQGTVQGCTVLSAVVTLRSDRDVGAVASDTLQRLPLLRAF